jgi:hypothetical protein
MHRLYSEFCQIRQHSSECLIVGEFCATDVETAPQYRTCDCCDDDRHDAHRFAREQPSTHSSGVVGVEQFCRLKALNTVSNIEFEPIDGSLSDNHGPVSITQLRAGL